MLMIIGALVVITVMYAILTKDTMTRIFNKLKQNISNSEPNESVIASLAFSKLAIDDNAITPGRSLVPVTGTYADDLEDYDTTEFKSKIQDTKLYPLF
jgi:hypothetical protein